ncbi:MAG TPA: ABC transporter permease, partial [Patescibacteria group bacterium]|nr:ABC transporter permease [Patescibacteria group bacterium]
MTSRVFLDYVDPWINWDWLGRHVPLILTAVQEHLTLTAIAVVAGLVISLPLAVLAHRRTGLRLPLLTAAGIFYTIPSIALFALLIPYTGLSGTTAEIPLVGYNVLILVRNILVGLDAVPPEIRDAADGMGYR